MKEYKTIRQLSAMYPVSGVDSYRAWGLMLNKWCDCGLFRPEHIEIGDRFGTLGRRPYAYDMDRVMEILRTSDNYTAVCIRREHAEAVGAL